MELHYSDRGDGVPLVLLHGGLGVGDDWRHVFPADPPGFRLIVPDLRGHGRTRSGDETFTIRACARDVLALLDRLSIRRARAIGLSLGAKTLLHMATIEPQRSG
jgi:pimeloyl-ACP methyl ester carboxylesterase